MLALAKTLQMPDRYSDSRLWCAHLTKLTMLACLRRALRGLPLHTQSLTWEQVLKGIDYEKGRKKLPFGEPPLEVSLPTALGELAPHSGVDAAAADTSASSSSSSESEDVTGRVSGSETGDGSDSEASQSEETGVDDGLCPRKAGTFTNDSVRLLLSASRRGHLHIAKQQ